MSSQRHCYSRLPHDVRPNLLQALTFRLFDSLPPFLERKLIEVMRKHKGYEDYLDEFSEQFRKLFQTQLDTGQGKCLLASPIAADIVYQKIFERNHQMYDVIAWCIMPNHVHLVLYVLDRLDKCMQHIKGGSSKELNLLTGTPGKTVWAENYYDRRIRDTTHFINAINYVLDNPYRCNASDEFTGVIPEFMGYSNLLPRT